MGLEGFNIDTVLMQPMRMRRRFYGKVRFEGSKSSVP